MWKSIGTKVAIGVLGTGTIATGVAFAVTPSSNENNYESYLNKQGRQLLPQISNHWKTLVGKYSTEGSDLLISIDGQQKSTLQENELKTWCSQNSKKSFTNTKDTTYQKVSAWCTEPKTIGQSLKGKTILSDVEPSDGQNNANDTDWTAKVNKYKEDQNTDLIKEMSGENQEGSEIPAKDFSDAKKLRAWCRFSKAKHFKHEEDPRFLKYLKWCTK